MDIYKDLRWIKSSFVQYRNEKFYERDTPESYTFTREYMATNTEPDWTLCWMSHYEHWQLMYMISLEEN